MWFFPDATSARVMRFECKSRFYRNVRDAILWPSGLRFPRAGFGGRLRLFQIAIAVLCFVGQYPPRFIRCRKTCCMLWDYVRTIENYTERRRLGRAGAPSCCVGLRFFNAHVQSIKMGDSYFHNRSHRRICFLRSGYQCRSKIFQNLVCIRGRCGAIRSDSTRRSLGSP